MSVKHAATDGGAFNARQIATEMAQIKEHYDPYKALACAIACQAFFDLRDVYSGNAGKTSIRHLKSGDKKVNVDSALLYKDDLERFFTDGAYEFYTDREDGEYVIRIAKLQAQYDVFRKRHKCTSCRKKCKFRNVDSWRLIESIDDMACPLGEVRARKGA